MRRLVGVVAALAGAGAFALPAHAGNGVQENVPLLPAAPTIDGTLGLSGEWSAANSFVATFGSVSGTVYVGRTATDLYIALDVNDPAGAATAGTSINFEGGNDGTLSPGDDIIGLNAGGPPLDFYFITATPASVTSGPDTSNSGTLDLDAASTVSGGHYFVEYRHPLCDADTAHDICFTPPPAGGPDAKIGFDIFYGNGGAAVGYPTNLFDWANWGAFVIQATPDTTPPSAPILTISNSTQAYFASGTSTLWYQAGTNGNFVLNASGSDPESGISFAKLPNFESNPVLPAGWDTGASTATSLQYYFPSSDAFPPPTATYHATLVNGANLQGPSTDFTFNTDGAAPTGLLACSPCTSANAPVTVTVSANDGNGSGLRDLRYTTNGLDPNADSGTQTQPGAQIVITSPNTTVKLWGVDNVGNAAVLATIVASGSPFCGVLGNCGFENALLPSQNNNCNPAITANISFGNWTPFYACNNPSPPSLIDGPQHDGINSGAVTSSTWPSGGNGEFFLQDVPNASFDPNQGFELTAWVYLSVGTTEGDLLFDWDRGIGNSVGTAGFNIGQNTIQFGAWGQSTAVETSFALNTWHEVKLRAEAGTYTSKLTVDGQLLGQITTTGSPYKLSRAFPSPHTALILGDGCGTCTNAKSAFFDDVSLVQLQAPDQPQTGGTLTVNTAADHDDATGCTVADCSLREAILAANNLEGPHTIAFNISGPGVHTITVATPLPTATGQVTIDGYTQPGATPNTLEVGDNAQLLIELHAPPATRDVSGNLQPVTATAAGLNLGGSGSVVRGLVVSGGFLYGIQASGNGVTISGNFIGTDPTGTISQTPAIYGVGIFGGSNTNLVGGPNPADRNLISGVVGVSGSNGAGVAIGTGATENTVQGNYIGTDPTGTSAVGNWTGVAFTSTTTFNVITGNTISGNGGDGLYMQQAGGFGPTSGNEIGNNSIGVNVNGEALGNGGNGIFGSAGITNTQIHNNEIAFNGAKGVSLIDSFAQPVNGVSILGNSIHDNTGIGIDLGDNGVTPNDLNDVDNGVNRGQNFPVITAAGTTTASGTLNTGGGPYTVEVYVSPTCDPSGNGEGQTFFGSTVVNNGEIGGGNSLWSVTADGSTIPAGSAVTATATSQITGDTSEFSNCFQTVRTVSNATFRVDESSTPAGAASFAIDSLPPQLFQLLAGAVNAAPIPSAPIPSAAVGAAPIPSAPIPSAPIPSAPIPSAPIPDAPIPSAPIPSAPIPSAGLGGLPIPSADVANPLDSVLLSSLPNLDVNALFAGTNLAGRLPQQYTLGDIYRAKSTTDNTTLLALQRFNALNVTQLPLSQTLLRGVRTLSYLLGGKTLGQISPYTQAAWCTALTNAGGSCANVNIATTTVIGLDIMRQLGTLDLGRLTVGDLTGGLNGSLVGEAYLARISLLRTTIAAVRLSSLATPSAVVDCGRVSCTSATATLGDAARLTPTAIRDQVPLKSLGSALNGVTLNELVVALTPRNAFPWEQESFVGWQGFGGQAQPLHYHLEFDALCPITGLQIRVQLPFGFLYLPGSTTFEFGEAAPVAGADPAQDPKTGATWSNITMPACGAGLQQHIQLNFVGLAGYKLGASPSTATINAGGGGTRLTGAPVLVTRNWSAALDRSTAPTIAKDTIYLSHVDRANGTNYFRLPESARGKVVTIYMRPPAGHDFDLYSVRPAPDSLLASPIPSAPIPSAPIPSAPIPSAPIPSADTSVTNTTDNPPPELLDDGPLPGGAVAVNSITRGDGVEAVSFRQAASSGFDEIAVAGYNGDFSDQPFELRVTVSDPAPLPATCPARTFTNGAPAQTGVLPVGPLPSTTQALALVNVGRMNAMYGIGPTSTMLGKLNTVMGSVNGAVLQIDGDTGVYNASRAWDASPCSIDASNAYVKAINTLVARFRGNLTNLRSITLVGGPEQLPPALVPDFVPTSSEFDNTGALSFLTQNNTVDNATYAAAALGYVQTDDAYGAFHTRTLFGHEFFLPEVALGRLVETSDEIGAQLQRFIDSTTKTLDGSTGFVTGYDFMSDGAKAVDDGIAARVGPVSLTNTLLRDGWDKTALTPFLDGTVAAAKINSWNAHYDFRRLMPAVAPNGTSDLVTTNTLPLTTPRFSGDIFFTMGCHAGESLSDTLFNDATATRDWAQAYAQNGAAVFIGNTGFGYGDTASVALSERLMAQFATHLGFNGSIGEKFMATKNEYFATMGAYGPFDEKSIEEATFYGLPFWSLNSPPEPTPTPPGPVTADGTTGLSVAPLTITPTLTRVDDPKRGTFWRGGSGVVFVQGRTVQPLETREVTQPTSTGLIAHGFFPTALGTHDVLDQNLYYAKPIIDLGAHEPEPVVTNDTFPANILKVAQTDYLGVRHSTIDLIAGQSRPGSTPTLQNERLIDTVSGLVTYAPASVTDYTPPRFAQTGALVVNGAATIFATVSDESAGGVLRVRAFFTTGGAWTFVDLQPVPGVPNAWRATTAVDAAKIEVGFVAEDAAGNTGWMTDKGNLVTSFAGTPPASSIVIDRPLDGTTYTLSQSVPASYACSGKSGVAGCTGNVANGAAIDTTAIGTKNFTVTATPLIGNSTSKTVSYSVAYNFGGFQPPISSTAINQVKAGQAVPVKFSLKGNFGLGIMAPGYPKSGPVACTGGTVDVADSTSTAGNSSLQYDAGSDTYTYVWKTEKSWTGCRQLLVVLNDGVIRRATFQFK